MFHDFGLVPEFDSHTISFEKAGGNVAQVFAAGAGWSAERRNHLSGLIFRHICGDRVEESSDPQGFLLARAAGVEITGRHADDLPAGFRADVLERYRGSVLSGSSWRSITTRRSASLTARPRPRYEPTSTGGWRVTRSMTPLSGRRRETERGQRVWL